MRTLPMSIFKQIISRMNAFRNAINKLFTGLGKKDKLQNRGWKILWV
jgi:hypothetical protein